jgi:beta-lactamase superfamily II metal-dependent hydrolase
MATPSPVPVDHFTDGEFLDDIERDDLVYFLLNVGDGDAQLVVLPADRDGRRRAIVVDAGIRKKLPALVDALIDREFLTHRDDLFSVVVGTHPHEDHLAGMPEFLDRLGDLVREYWEPGYYHPSPSYMETMRALEEHPKIQHSQPTSGLTRFVGQVRVVVLSPTISLRNRFDSYGVTINNASIALKIEFPASRVEQRGSDRRYLRIRRTQALMLGADAQTLSWGKVMSDFPELRAEDSPVAKQLRMALGANPLRAQVFKVPHHASKHGVNLELVELIKPAFSLISCASGGGRYHFPHTVAQESVREALEAIATTGATHRPDHDLGIHYTGSSDTDDRILGSIAVVMSPTGRKRNLWRFGDRADEPLPLDGGRLYLGKDLSAELPTEEVETVAM